MGKVETVKIVSEASDDGYAVINKSDFDADTMELYEADADEGSAGSGDGSGDGNKPTKVQLEAELKLTGDEPFNEGLEQVTEDMAREMLTVLEVEFNKNLGVKKLRELIADHRKALIDAANA